MTTATIALAQLFALAAAIGLALTHDLHRLAPGHLAAAYLGAATIGAIVGWFHDRGAAANPLPRRDPLADA